MSLYKPEDIKANIKKQIEMKIISSMEIGKYYCEYENNINDNNEEASGIFTEIFYEIMDEIEKELKTIGWKKIESKYDDDNSCWIITWQ
jgi:hypothetical protein